MINRKENLHMKKRLPVILIIMAIIAIALIYIFTRHTRTFAEATCTTAQTCECGEIEGEPLGHTWVDATCTTAKTCSVCNLTEGTPLEHQWIEATTENPKTCKLCGTTEGEPLPTKQGTVEGYTAEAPAEAESYELDADGYIESIEAPELKDDGLDEVRQKAYESYTSGKITEEQYKRRLEAIENGDKVKAAIQESGRKAREEWAAEHQNPAVDREPPKIGSGQVDNTADNAGPAKLNDNPALSGFTID